MCRASTRRPGHAACGYTLLEALIVLSIFLLIIAAAPTLAPSVVAGAKFQDRSDAMLAAIQSSKHRARASGVLQPFSLADARRAVAARGESKLPNGYSVTMEGNIVFYPNGVATAGTVQITAGDRTVEVFVDGVTGSIGRRSL